MNLKISEYRALLRQDLHAFIERSFYHLNPTTEFLDNWHIQEIAAALEECRQGYTKRLIINVPPRFLKSHCATVAFPAWLLGHNPSAQIICASYAQELANKHAMDCRSLLASGWYQGLFPTRLSSERQAVPEYMTTEKGFRMATSVGGMLTGRGADYIIIDDPLKPDEALSDVQRKGVNNWFHHTLYSRLNDKRTGCIILIMQRLHEDDLVGHVLGMEPWNVIRFPAIAEEDEVHVIQTPYGTQRFERRAGEALHTDREPLEVLNRIREAQGEYNFSGQYQQAPAPLGGGLVKAEWFRTFTPADQPAKFEMTLQSWDTANKPTELSDYTVCTTWGVKDKHLYLLNVYRKRVGYPELKRAVREQAEAFGANTILVEDKASGTQLIQELVSEGVHAIKKYEPTMDKTMRMHSVTSTIENGFVHLPETAAWRGEFLHELATFPKGKYDDQADSTSQALDWFKKDSMTWTYGLLEYLKQETERLKAERQSVTVPQSRPCSNCNGVMSQLVAGGLRCAQCGAQWSPSDNQPRVQLTRSDILNRTRFRFRG
jgi:predicted phage terminase large subunit-like protein